MAFQIPSFLQFAPPEGIIQDLVNNRERTLAREQNRDLNLAELGLRRDQLAAQQQARMVDEAARSQDLQFKQFALQQNMTSDQAKLALEQQKLAEDAKVAAIQFQGTQNLQRDLAAGVPFEQSIIRHIPMITFGNPAALSGFANTLNRGASQQDVAALNAQNRLDNTNLKNEMEIFKTEQKTQLEQVKHQNKLKEIEARFQKMIPRLNAVDLGLMNEEIAEIKNKDLSEEERNKEYERIEMKYSSRLSGGNTKALTYDRKTKTFR